MRTSSWATLVYNFLFFPSIAKDCFPSSHGNMAK
jgi:hypothetical protein